MHVRFVPRNFEKVTAYLKTLPHGVIGVAMPAIAEYMLGDDEHGYKHYPPLKGQAYLKTTPPGYVRTGDAKNSWTIKGTKWKPIIVSEGVYYVRYIPRWKQYGWREWLQVALDNMQGAIRHANAKVRAYLKAKS